MNYSDIKSQIKSGDVLAWTYNGWGSLLALGAQIIRIATGSEYYHIGVARVRDGEVYVVEAVLSGVREVPLSIKGDFFWVKTDVTWTPEADAEASAHIGEKYSILQAILSRFTEPRKDRRWQCAELTKTILTKVGLHISYHPTPENIMRALREYGKQTVFVKNV